MRTGFRVPAKETPPLSRISILDSPVYTHVAEVEHYTASVIGIQSWCHCVIGVLRLLRLEIRIRLESCPAQVDPVLGGTGPPEFSRRFDGAPIRQSADSEPLQG